MDTFELVESLYILGVVVAVIIALFFLFRVILLWYGKIDKIVENQEKQSELLKEILTELSLKNIQNMIDEEKAKAYDAKKREMASSEDVFDMRCPNCGEAYDKTTNKACTKCGQELAKVES
ncbi:hypothetical protein ACFLU5_14850 [Bacteroidota bacterium]